MLRHRSDVKCFKTKCCLNTFFRLDDHQYTLKSIFFHVKQLIFYLLKQQNKYLESTRVFPPFYIKKCHKDFANLEHDVMVTMKLLCRLLLTISCSFYFNKNMSKRFWESINTQKWPYISSKNSILIENAHFNFTFIER